MLENFLDTKPLYYDEIDYARMPKVYAKIKSKLTIPKIIHLIGTNGKGTTGRFLASALVSLGYNVGHYTSPHIVEFNERIWLNGYNLSYPKLEQSHQQLLSLLDPYESGSLSYFEYTTLLAIVAFRDCDYIVFEAGLGGEYDATAVFENIVTLVTPIDKDHEGFLGDTLQQIAQTKLNAIQKVAIFAKQKYKIIETIADEMVQNKAISVYLLEELLEDEDRCKIQEIARDLSLVPYLQENLSLAIAALKYLKIEYHKDSFYTEPLFGRLTQIDDNIILDVGHNVLAAHKIKETLLGEKYILVYNSYKDKNYKEILSVLKPIIAQVAIIEVDEVRIEKQDILKKALNQLEIQYKNFQGIEANKKYLVFGSFSVVERFLKDYIE